MSEVTLQCMDKKAQAPMCDYLQMVLCFIVGLEWDVKKASREQWTVAVMSWLEVFCYCCQTFLNFPSFLVN